MSCRLETIHGGDGRAFMSRATIAAANQSLMLPAELADSWTTGSGTVSVTCRTLGGTAMIDQAILTVTPVGSVESPVA